MTSEIENTTERDTARAATKAYLVGGGIASLAAAVYLIRDGGLTGSNITIMEELNSLAGSLDASGSAKYGYVLRGGRMLERKYLCTFDLFATIPTLDKSKSVTEEIFDWNEKIETCSYSRLVKEAKAINKPTFDLDEKQILTLARLMIEPEWALANATIEEQFSQDFFNTNFWLMWCTTFAFQPWHSAIEFKRYLQRFTHLVHGFNQLHGIMRTVYNQFDSMVRPLHTWLIEQGVNFGMNATVIDLKFGRSESQGGTVTNIIYKQEGEQKEIALAPRDLVIVTLGSMTDGSSQGGNDTSTPSSGAGGHGAWTLWQTIADGRAEFGRPDVFANHIDESKWISATTTLQDPAFFDFVQRFTGNKPGEGGLITLADSNWLLSFVLPCQPHFIDQPDNINVFWSYGLSVDKPGNFIKKTMQDCTGREIFAELMGHLGMDNEEIEIILNQSITIPTYMPFVTSQFLRRQSGDRPQIIPDGWGNLGLIGQFCEQADDVVFTVEYSVRSAATAVYKLLGLDREPPAVYKGLYDPRIVIEAIQTLHS